MKKQKKTEVYYKDGAHARPGLGVECRWLSQASPGELSEPKAASSPHLPASQDLTCLSLDLQSAPGPSSLVVRANDTGISFSQF